jgi:hypothetical protein
MFPRKRSFFSLRTWFLFGATKALLALGTWLFPREQFKPLFISGIFFHPFCSWMKNIVKKKVQTHDLWAIKGILTIVLVFSLKIILRKCI